MFLPPMLSRILIRGADRLQGRGVWPAYRALQESQWWGRPQLLEMQCLKLRHRIAAAAAGSPFLARRLHEAGVDPETIRAPEDLSRLPVLERDDLRRLEEEVRAGPAVLNGATWNSTGGSTGSNVSFLVDRPCWRQRDAAHLRVFSFLGLEPGESMISLWGSPMDQRAAGRMKERIRRAMENRRFFSAYSIGRQDLDPVLDWLARHRPAALMGYASVLEKAARRALERGGMEGPRAIISAAEVLYPEQRVRIEKAWGAPVFNLYGCREMGILAMECHEHHGLHFMDERVVVQRSASEEGPADLLLTDLDNGATPFIRYRIGDLAGEAETKPCPCGRGLSRLSSLQGRSFDVIEGPSGQAVGGTFWSLLLRTAVSGIETWQVVQHAPDRLEIRVTPEGALSVTSRAILVEKIRVALGDAMAVEFVELDDLPPLPSGKHRFVVARGGAGK